MGSSNYEEELQYHTYPNEMGNISIWTDCDDDELWIAWGNNIFGIQQYQLHWYNLSVTSVTSYKNMTKN